MIDQRMNARKSAMSAAAGNALVLQACLDGPRFRPLTSKGLKGGDNLFAQAVVRITDLEPLKPQPIASIYEHHANEIDDDGIRHHLVRIVRGRPLKS